jgi:hypothetical protein
MRPILFDVDTATTPAQMAICFPGRPHRFVTIPIRSAFPPRLDPKAIAMWEFMAFTPAKLAELDTRAVEVGDPVNGPW